MKIKTFLVIIIVLLLVIVVNIKVNAFKDYEIIDEKIYYEGTIDDDFASNKIIIMLSKEETFNNKDYTVDDFPEIDCKSIIDLTEDAMKLIKEKRTNKSLINFDKFRRILCLELKHETKAKVLLGIKELEKRKEIISAEPSFSAYLMSTPSDTQLSGQWGLVNSKAYDSWDICNNASQVLVGVIDSGIDSLHEDLTDNIYRKTPHNIQTTLHRDFTDGSESGIAVLEPSDPNGHGTHVAGIIGAKGNNNLGVAGICWDVKLVSLRVLGSDGNGDIDYVTHAISYAGTKNIPILNCSLGSTLGSPSLKNAIDSYMGLIVCAAGNEGKNIDSNPVYPASYDSNNILTVGAIDSNNNRSNWNGFSNLWGIFGNSSSNYGDTSVDLYAPGTDILSTVPSSNYDEMCGTSMSAPFVTGAAALLYAANSTLTSFQLKEALINGASSINITVPGGSGCGGNVSKSVLKLNIFDSIKLIAFKTNSTGETIIGTWFNVDEDIEIPSLINDIAVTSIGSNAFKNCSSLINVTLPNTLTSIGNSAFEGCTSLEDIEIPSSVTSIGYNAFKNCSSLSSIEIKRAQKDLITLGTNAFQGCSSLTEIIVPRDRMADYKNSSGWSSYRSLIIPNNTNYPSYNLNKYSNINLPNYNIDAGYNIMYQLNVGTNYGYIFTITSGTNPIIKLYNSSFVLIDSDNSSIEAVLQSAHTYYLSVEHSDITTSGVISVNIQKDSNHVHIYDDYIWYSYTQHQKKCSCGTSDGYEPHAVSQGSLQPGEQYATCLLCGGLASVGFVGPFGNNEYPTTLNGSYILPNGVVVLAIDDIDAYLDGTLVFNYPNIGLPNSNNVSPYFVRKEDEYLL